MARPEPLQGVRQPKPHPAKTQDVSDSRSCSEVRDNLAPSNGGECDEDILVDVGVNAANMTVAEQEVDAVSRVQAAPAVLAVVRVDDLRTLEVVGHQPDVRL